MWEICLTRVCISCRHKGQVSSCKAHSMHRSLKEKKIQLKSAFTVWKTTTTTAALSSLETLKSLSVEIRNCKLGVADPQALRGAHAAQHLTARAVGQDYTCRLLLILTLALVWRRAVPVPCVNLSPLLIEAHWAWLFLALQQPDTRPLAMLLPQVLNQHYGTGLHWINLLAGYVEAGKCYYGITHTAVPFLAFRGILWLQIIYLFNF